ncbi:MULTISPECIES: ROK family transcriptional regulator [unclassified Streptomyces]|uniref:ROK family transcriptional regulator n=2 Tax=unclassified Streptomyces TaxID=2593676 RepID=UPI000223B346|nr:ROK family protein [Streptomyces sp. SirexAA-E]MYR69427.1 ROK family protein [Streptomyces sp. SID4939]MYT66359.1 ROK family protein [Streptomyces sp. SID8357]MYT83279.1 ROK family protein [Streptomyces sp. SID8360]MYW35988.1 ROK family protein [Streptomyces sp. SID1]PZX42839.1 putative NBD/HSP70 family sugar kinase [Streptomyces sp. DvalAA-21]RAJ39129.1 putative NBD/HSP70 family sugar kinase [Streptomyces sp. DpondAA-E10]RAJ53090.1 putative NBD/HSP70 family sugar kinase [Streptomyces sp.
MLSGMHTHGGPLTQLRRGHEESVLGLLRRHGPQSRAELGRRVGLSRTTLYDIVATLVASGAVVSSAADPGPRRRGRPVERLSLDPSAGQAVGVDFARRAVRVAAANVAHEVTGSASAAHPAGLSWRRRVALAEELVGSVAGKTLRLTTLGTAGAVGVGVVGPVRLTGEGHVPDGPLADLAELLGERFGAPVLLDNNTRLAALAECSWGAAAGSRDVLYLRLSHGVGGGLVVNGSLHRGVDGLAGEFGHITAEPGGRPCECGGSGCLETVASVGAVLDAYRAGGGRADDVDTLLAAAAAGDRVALRVLEAAGTRTGAVLASVVNAVGPLVIVLGGELAAAGDALLGPVGRALDAHVLPLARDGVTLRRTALGEAAGALGGVALALHESPLLARYPGADDLEEAL